MHHRWFIIHPIHKLNLVKTQCIKKQYTNGWIRLDCNDFVNHLVTPRWSLQRNGNKQKKENGEPRIATMVNNGVWNDKWKWNKSFEQISRPNGPKYQIIPLLFLLSWFLRAQYIQGPIFNMVQKLKNSSALPNWLLRKKQKCKT